MHISEAGLALIRQFEGLRLSAYRCPAGIATIWSPFLLLNRLSYQLPAAANRTFKDSEAVVKHGPGSYPLVFAVALLGHSH